jgi:cytochrome P450
MSAQLVVPVNPVPRIPVWRIFGTLWKIREGSLDQAVSLVRLQPGAFRITAGPLGVLILNDPALVEEVLVKHHKIYKKDQGIQALRRVLGNGLLTSEDEFHLRQRRLIQPAFHRQRIAAYGDCMVRYARELSDTWQDSDTVDINTEMMAVTLSIIGKTMFDTEVGGVAANVAHDLENVIKYHDIYAVPVVRWIFERLPIPPSIKFRRSMKRLDDTIYQMIDDHLKAEEDNGDLMSMLLLSRDEDGSQMDLRQIHDEAITLFLAGHETTAIAMTWTWYLLSQHPEVEARLHEELDRVLTDGRDATAADVEKLVYTRQVFTESMRLYPPAWGFGRLAKEDHQLGPHRVRKNQIVIMSPYLMHRMPEWFPNPDAFDPDRWLPERCASLPKFAYFPFGGGVRKCIGEPFAWMEGILLLATFAQRWKMRLAPDAKVGLDPKITLRPRHGLKMVLKKR